MRAELDEAAKVLITKCTSAHDAADAMKYAQAVLNLTQAALAIQTLGNNAPSPGTTRSNGPK